MRCCVVEVCVEQGSEDSTGTAVQMESLTLQLMLESEEAWGRTPTTVIALRRTRDTPVCINIRNNPAPAQWCPPAHLSHHTPDKLALQAAAVASAPVFVHATAPQLDLSFTNTTYSLLMAQLFGTDDTHTPPTEQPTVPEQAVSWCLLLSVQRSAWELTEEQAPALARTATLPDRLPATYTAQLEDATVLFVSEEGERSWLSGQLQEVTVWEARAGHEAKEVMNGAPRFAAEAEAAALPVLSVLCGFGVEENTDQIELLFRELAYRYHVGSMWVLRVQEFLVPTQEPPEQMTERPPLITKLHLELQHVSIHHQPILHPAAVLLHVSSAQLETTIVDSCPEVVLWLGLDRAEGYMAREATALAGVLGEGRRAHKARMCDVLGEAGVVQLARLTDVEATVTVGEQAPGLDVDVRNPKGGELKLSLCADSCGVLVQLATHWIDAVDVGGQVLAEPLSPSSGLEQSMLIALLGDIDPLAFAAQDTAQQHGTAQHSAATEAPFVIDDFYQRRQPREESHARHAGAGIGGGWLVEPLICDDYFNTRHADNEARKGLGVLGELDAAVGYPRLVSRLTLTNLNLCVELYGGFDWADQLPDVDAFMPMPDTDSAAGEEPPPSPSSPSVLLGRDPSTMLRIDLRGAMVRYWEFEPRQQHSWRLVASVQELELYDCLCKSAWKKFLTRSRRGGEMQSSRAMVRVELDALHPDSDKLVEDWCFKLSLVPLKLNIDQDALDFLIAFLSFEADLIESQEDELSLPPQIFFQSFELSALHVCIDYKAKHFDVVSTLPGFLLTYLALTTRIASSRFCAGQAAGRSLRGACESVVSGGDGAQLRASAAHWGVGLGGCGHRSAVCVGALHMGRAAAQVRSVSAADPVRIQRGLWHVRLDLPPHVRRAISAQGGAARHRLLRLEGVVRGDVSGCTHGSHSTDRFGARARHCHPRATAPRLQHLPGRSRPL
eukprot:TRINITY_DN1742_c0_g3_i2.p1 TRINITY_DN1742_c0_g3~~TRINITY_DN1742_c0_g3_i2.p1  ORF type:complete len:951 (+),score=239.45 TRINITY_DN1742_c0_g3_i2:211-3063(+)